MSFKKDLKTYFSFSSSERKSVIILIVIVLGAIAYPFFVFRDEVPVWEQNTKEQKKLDSLLLALSTLKKDGNENIEPQKLVFFDPNIIDSSGLQLLGFSNYATRNLLAYRNSGGYIANKLDLKKIYGITDDLYLRLEPFVKIASKKRQSSPGLKVKMVPFDLNKVDSLELLSLGFSEFQTRNFIRYRNKLGLFNKKEELKNVYGISSADFENYEKYIRIEANRMEMKVYLFPFDPNLISRNAWDSLGVKPGLVDRIKNFLSKGGRFYKAGDLKKIYGFDSLKYVELEPYITIFKKRIAEIVLVDLNLADSASLQSLPGIGPYFSKQIINYRKKLGGFCNVDQLQDIRGLKMSRVDSIRKYLTLNVVDLHLININEATLDELNEHPYISFKEASDIVRLRKRKGVILDLEILQKRKVFSKFSFTRVKPYLVLE